MIDCYTWPTPNGRKVTIMLEEVAALRPGFEYRTHAVNIGKDEQFEPAFLAISPNNKIPAIVDQEAGGRTLMESGAILLYLAEKFDCLMPTDDNDRWRAIEWLMWQMGGLGPMLGQVHHFVRYNPGKSEYAEQRYSAEAQRLYGVLDRRLGDAPYLAGNDYSIADIAAWPWVSRFEWQGIDLAALPNVSRWYRAIAGRPAVVRGYALPVEVNEIPMP